MLQPDIPRAGKQPVQLPDDRFEKRQAIVFGAVLAQVPVHPAKKLNHASLRVLHPKW